MQELNLRQRVLSALKWLTAARTAGQLGTWVITLIVIRILSPEDYGLMAAVAVVLGLAALTNELGLTPALIQRKQIDRMVVRKVFGFLLLSNLAVVGIILSAAPLAADFFREPDLVPLIRVASAQLIIGALGGIPRALLSRELRFRALSLIDFTSVLAGSLTTLALALNGAAVWSLIFGSLVTISWASLATVIVGRFLMLPSFDFSGLSQMFRFGMNVTGGRIVAYLNNETDTLFIGRLLGADALGIFSVGRHVTRMPAAKVMSILNEIAFPAFANIQADKERVANIFLRVIENACILFFPVFFGISAVSEEFVQVVLGPKWGETRFIIETMCFLMVFQIVQLIIDPVLSGVGRPEIEFRNQLTVLTFRIPAILLGVQWGLAGVAIALLAAIVPSFLINMGRSAPAIGVSLLAVLARFGRAGLTSGAMYLAVKALGLLVLADWPALWRLPPMVVVGVASYAVLVLIFHKAAMLDLVDMLRSAKGPGAARIGAE